MTRDEAELEMARRVFGHDVKFTPDGRPIEVGIGSAQNQTEQHRAALAQAAVRRGKP
jgi:hypothetical protein